MKVYNKTFLCTNYNNSFNYLICDYKKYVKLNSKQVLEKGIIMEELFQHIQDIINLPEFIMGYCTFLPEYIRQAIIDSIKFVPFLYFLYFAIELLERFFLKNIELFTKLIQKLGALFGIVISIVPECGYQVIASTFYARRMISRGTLLAFFIMCSDDALPLLFMDFSKAYYIIPALMIKAIVAFVVAYGFNFISFIRHRGNKTTEKINSINTDINVKGCCYHNMMTIEHPPYWYMHPFTHTVNIFIYTMVTLSFIYGGIQTYGAENLASMLLINSPLQVVAVAVIGGLSNCVVSILIALAFVKGLISFPAFVAGLISITGMGIYTLTKQNVNKQEISVISSALLVISVIAGLIVYYSFGI